jgi:tetratricopeptide (TPR) repeat protein
VATNPRIEDLRKRIEKDPASRLFAQLAEELRKDGELEDAIRVAREGLRTHPNYPSARMTLGRALLDTGDWGAARTEFELVLKSAPDNILASRYLGECLEGLGERDAAIARYKATLAMAPGEKHVVARLQELEGGTAAPAGRGGAAAAKPAPVPAARPVSALRPASSTLPPVPGPGSAALPAAAASSMPPVISAPSLAAPPPTPPPAPLPPIPLSAVDGEMELETGRSGDRARPSPPPVEESPLAPIPLVDTEEEFELERPYDSPTVSAPARPAASAPAPPLSAPAVPVAPATPAEAAEEEFELEAPHAAPSTNWAATIRPLPVMEEPAPPASPRPASPASPAVPPPASPAAPTGPSSLISPTLGELYFNQGFTAKAIEVYRQLTVREPANERLSARLRELEKLQGALGGEAAPASSSDSPSAERRQAIERTIERLEGLLSAIRKG